MWSARTRGDARGGRRGRANSALPYNGYGGGEKRRENCGRAEALPYNGYGGEEKRGAVVVNGAVSVFRRLRFFRWLRLGARALPGCGKGRSFRDYWRGFGDSNVGTLRGRVAERSAAGNRSITDLLPVNFSCGGAGEKRRQAAGATKEDGST